MENIKKYNLAGPQKVIEPIYGALKKCPPTGTPPSPHSDDVRLEIQQTRGGVTAFQGVAMSEGVGIILTTPLSYPLDQQPPSETILDVSGPIPADKQPRNHKS